MSHFFTVVAFKKNTSDVGVVGDQSGPTSYVILAFLLTLNY